MTSVAFGPKGATIVSGSTDGKVRLHAALDGSVTDTLGEHADFVHAIACAADGTLVASGSDDGVFMLWSLRTKKLVRTWKVTAKRSAHRMVWALRFDRAAARLYAGMGDGVVHVFDTASGKEVRRFEGHKDRVLALALDPREERLATSSGDRTVRIWSLKTGRLLAQLGGHAETVYATVWHPTGRWLASGSQDGTVRLWDPRAGLLRQRLDASREGVYGLAFAPDGKRLAVSCADGKARVYTRE